jgi:hypothetical protein
LFPLLIPSYLQRLAVTVGGEDGNDFIVGHVVSLSKWRIE